MIRFRTFCLFIISFFYAGISFGQISKPNTIVGQKVFAVEDILCESSKTCNSFLKVISRSSGFPISKASYTIHYQIKYIYAPDFTIQGEIIIDSISGSTIYREFNLADYLYPSSVELGWVFVDPNGNTIPGGYSESFFDVLKTGHLMLHLPVNHKIVDIVFDDIQFIYRENDFLQFDSISRVIQDYYAASDICDTLLTGIANSSYDLQLLAGEEFIYFDFIRVYESFLYSDRFEELNLLVKDPADYHGDLRKVKGRLNGMRLNLDEKYQAWNKLVKKVSPKYFAHAIFQQSISWYGMSERVDYNYHDLVYALGNYNLDDNYLLTNTMLEHLVKYVDDSYEDPEKLIAVLTADYFLEAAQVALQQENYTYSISLVNNAIYFYNYSNSDTEIARDVEKSAWLGLYNSFLLVARRTIAIGNFEFSEAYLNDAWDVQVDSQGAIPAPTQVFVYFDTLYNALYQQGIQSLQRNISRDALFFLSEAGRIDSSYLNAVHANDVAHLIGSLEHTTYYSKLGLIENSLHSGDARMARKYYDDVILYAQQQSLIGDEQLLDSLNRDIVNLEYLELLNRAVEFYSISKNDEATDIMTQAAFYLNHYHLASTNMYDSLVRQIIIPALKEEMSIGRVLIWGGKLNMARTTIDKIRSKINLFDIKDEATLVFVDDFERRLQEKICNNAENEFNKRLFVVKKSVRERDFLYAAKVLTNIFIADTVDCLVHVSDADSIWRKYYNVFMYEQYIDSCKTAIIYGKTDEIVRCFNEATFFHNHIEISNLSPNTVALPALVELYHKESLSLSLAWRTLESDPVVSLLFVRQYLNTFPADKKNTNKLQLRLGCRLATYDLTNRYPISAGKYSEGISSLRRFDFSYNMNTKPGKNICNKWISNITCGE